MWVRLNGNMARTINSLISVLQRNRTNRIYRKRRGKIYFKELALMMVVAGFKFAGQTNKQETQGRVCCSLESEGNLEAKFLLRQEPVVFFLRACN